MAASPSPSGPRVVVTGLAIWSPYGQGLSCFWDGISQPVSARKPIHRLTATMPPYRSDQAAEIEDIGCEDDEDADQSASRILQTVCADLLADAGLSSGADAAVKSWEVGVYLGSSQSVSWPLREYLHAQRGGRTAVLPPEKTPLSAASVAAEVAEWVGAQGPALVVSTACASSTSAIGIAANAIRQGRIRRAVVGGVGYFTEITYSGFNILRLIGREGCRPFESTRDGMMMGDGFALALLEAEDVAQERAARVRAQIVGHASGNEAFHPTSPSPEGNAAFRVMWGALDHSPDSWPQLDYVNAHGTGTPVNDAAEVAALQRLLELRPHGKNGVAVSSTKGHHGHALGAAGAVEFVATVLALEKGIVPPNVGLTTPDPAFAGIDLVQGMARSASHPHRAFQLVCFWRQCQRYSHRRPADCFAMTTIEGIARLRSR